MIYIGENLKKLSDLFYNAGEKLYVVGGYVRDCILACVKESEGDKPDPRGGVSERGAAKPVLDIDLAAAVPVEKLKELCAGSGFLIKERNGALGTLVIRIGDEAYEYTALRSESYRGRGGGHTPSRVSFEKDISVDMLRRDFSANSLYFDIREGRLIDGCGGTDDIKNRILKTVDAPKKVFSADGLRLMRLARFACTLGFKIEAHTLAAAKELSRSLADISRPRINEEFFKILHSADAAYGLRLLRELGLLRYIIPELDDGAGVAQNPQYHSYDVFEHIARTVGYCSEGTKTAGLLHDIGKPESLRKYGAMRYHTEIGIEIAKKALGREGFDFNENRKSRTLRLIEHHMLDIDCAMGARKVKIFILNNLDILDDLLDLKQADYLAAGKNSDICPTVLKWRGIYEAMRTAPTSVAELNIRAEDLIRELSPLEPKKIGLILKELLTRCAVSELKNEYPQLLKAAKEIKNTAIAAL
jgi:putative nucleotidyltransferase with HDIG domain